MGERAWIARRGHRLVVVVLVVRHRHFAGACGASPCVGGVLGEVVSLTAGDWLASGAVPGGYEVTGCGMVSAGVSDGVDRAGIAGVADAPELM